MILKYLLFIFVVLCLLLPFSCYLFGNIGSLNCVWMYLKKQTFLVNCLVYSTKRDLPFEIKKYYFKILSKISLTISINKDKMMMYFVPIMLVYFYCIMQLGPLSYDWNRYYFSTSHLSDFFINLKWLLMKAFLFLFAVPCFEYQLLKNKMAHFDKL